MVYVYGREQREDSRSHRVGTHSLSVVLLVCPLVLYFDVVLVNIAITIEITDILGRLTLVAEHREGRGEHGSVLVSVTVGCVGGVDRGALVDYWSARSIG
jgi:hypothetical protein